MGRRRMVNDPLSYSFLFLSFKKLFCLKRLKVAFLHVLA